MLERCAGREVQSKRQKRDSGLECRGTSGTCMRLPIENEPRSEPP